MRNKQCSLFKLFSVFILCSVQTGLYAEEKAIEKNQDNEVANEYPIAGTTPEQRPLGAPVLKEVRKSDTWYQNALKGIDFPQSEGGIRLFSLLLQQGNWYSPFTRPGMIGRYDIRNMHQATSSSSFDNREVSQEVKTESVVEDKSQVTNQ